MSARTITLLFRRDSSKDHQSGRIEFEGYEAFWPDGTPVQLGLDALCRQGQRLLGLGHHLKGRSERLIDLVFLPLSSREDDINRIPGHRVRRFFIERQGDIGRLHFLDGTPTTATFDVNRDEPRVLEWLGLLELGAGERQWFDLAATAPERSPRREARVAEAAV